jgi:hypothetical protein
MPFGLDCRDGKEAKVPGNAVTDRPDTVTSNCYAPQRDCFYARSHELRVINEIGTGRNLKRLQWPEQAGIGQFRIALDSIPGKHVDGQLIFDEGKKSGKECASVQVFHGQKHNGLFRFRFSEKVKMAQDCPDQQDAGDSCDHDRGNLGFLLHNIRERNAYGQNYCKSHTTRAASPFYDYAITP